MLFSPWRHGGLVVILTLHLRICWSAYKPCHHWQKELQKTTVVVNIEDKIKEGQTQLDNREYYRPLVNPMVEEANLRVQQLISELYLGTYLDEMTKTRLCQTPDLPCIPTFHT